MDDKRPEWTIREISEADFRMIEQHGNIRTITAKMEMTGCDTSMEWLEATNHQGKTIELPNSWRSAYEFRGGWSNPGLLWLNYVGKMARKNMDEIDAWEKKNKRERTEYERLKAKFG